MQAIILAGIIVAGLLVAVVLHFIRSYEFPAQEPVRPSILSPDTSPWMEPLTADQAASLAQQRIVTHASYMSDQQPAVLFTGAAEIGQNHWSTGFRVAQTFQETEQLYHHRVEVKDARIIRHEVSVSDAGERLTISSPEPEAILAEETVKLKGQTPERVSVVQLWVRNQAGNTVLQRQVPVQNSAFVSDITLPEPGNYVMSVSSGDIVVHIPFIYHGEASTL